MATELVYRLGAETKICAVCNQNKPRSDFPFVLNEERGECSHCYTAAQAKTPKESNYKTVAERRKYRLEWARNNPDKVRQYAKKFDWSSMTSEQKARRKEQARVRHLARKYGMTVADWDAMHAAQGGVCAICKVPGRLGKHGKLAVDHCHATGRVRGLLCTPCNISIGILGETPEQWEVVWKYLRGN